MSEIPDDVVAEMIVSDSPTTRAVGVFVGFLQARPADQPVMVSANQLLEQVNAAGLRVFIDTDVDAFVAEVVRRRARP